MQTVLVMQQKAAGKRRTQGWTKSTGVTEPRLCLGSPTCSASGALPVKQGHAQAAARLVLLQQQLGGVGDLARVVLHREAVLRPLGRREARLLRQARAQRVRQVLRWQRVGNPSSACSAKDKQHQAG